MMLNRIIKYAVNNKLVVGLMVLALIAYGTAQLSRLPIDAVPDITNNQVQVITVVPSFGATDIERLVTFPIEQVNNNIPGLKEIRSFSRFGLSLVTIVFDDATDVYWARQQVAERLQKIQTKIPAGVGIPELGPVTTGLGEIYQYVLRPAVGYERKYSITELRTVQDWIVRRQLLGVRGVAEVSSFGGRLKQYEIGLDPDKLKANNMTIEDVFNALERNNQNTGGAYIEKGPSVLNIRTEGLAGSLKDLERISVKTLDNGTPLVIGDIARVGFGSATRYGAMCYNSDGEVAGGIVMMLKGANSSDVILQVKERIAQVQKTLPRGIIIEPFLDRTKMVNNAIGTVETNLVEGALIVVFVLVLFLGNIRAGLLVASVIPLSMLFAVCMMNLFGVSGNLMSLGALDFGLIVDGAVIIVEAVMHRLRHVVPANDRMRLEQSAMDAEVNASAGKMMNSAVFGQIIILVVYLPIFTLQGIEGKMFRPMAQTVAFALAGAFILSLTYIPMMSALFLGKKTGGKANFSDRMMDQISRRYHKALAGALNYPKTLLSAALVLFILAITVLLFLGGEFIPTLEEGDFAVETRVLTGSSLNTTITYVQKAAAILKERFPEVQKVVSKIGSGEVPTDPMPMDAGDLMVILKDKREWTSARTFDELAAKMTAALENLPGVTFSFQYPVQMRFNELMTGSKQDVVCKIFGEDLDTLAAYARKMGAIAGSVEGAADLYIEPVNGMPQVVIVYNREAISQYGLSVSEINRVVNASFAGQSAGQVFENEKRFDLVVRLENNRRQSVADVRNLLVATPRGTQVPLQQLAAIEIKDGPNQVQREDAKRRIVVGFNVRGRDVQSVVNELQRKVEAQVHFPPGYYATYGGAFENLNAAKKRLMLAVPVSLLLIFLLLYFAFSSVRQGLLIYSAIPLSAIGGIFALALRGMPFSISAGVGFIALFGVAVLNGIVLIAEFNRRRNEPHDNLKEVVISATLVRLRPVLMTALVASLGFLPMAMSNGSGAEVQRPLATVVIGGLLIATLLTLFILPALYLLFESANNAKPRPGPISKLAGIALLLGLCNPLNAQNAIGLQAAIDSALKNNQAIKGEKLRAEYRKKLIASGIDLPKAQVGAEYGQINSSYRDNRLSVAQAFSFPTVYARQKEFLRGEWRSSLFEVTLREAEVRKNVCFAYTDLEALLQKRGLLQKADSLLSAVLTLAIKRYDKGETDLLEKTSTEVQRAQLALQLAQLNTDIETAALQFNLVLNTAGSYLPEAGAVKVEVSSKITEPVAGEHPLGKIFYQQKQQALFSSRLERSRLMPDISLQYNNMSMLGTGADNILYSNRSARFQSAQLSIGIPVFFGAQRSRIAAARSLQLQADNNYEAAVKSLNADFYAALTRYRNSSRSVALYESELLEKAKAITGLAGRRYASGEINFMEWTVLLNQAILIQSDYINALRSNNESATQLNYLSTK